MLHSHLGAGSAGLLSSLPCGDKSTDQAYSQNTGHEGAGCHCCDACTVRTEVCCRDEFLPFAMMHGYLYELLCIVIWTRICRNLLVLPVTRLTLQLQPSTVNTARIRHVQLRRCGKIFRLLIAAFNGSVRPLMRMTVRGITLRKDGHDQVRG